MSQVLKELNNKEILLRLESASVRFGGVQALHEVSVSIDEGEMVALLGPNGAGKSTVLKALFGLVALSRGSVLFHGSTVKPLPHVMVLSGIAFVPQGRRVFSRLTVEENLLLAGSVALAGVDTHRRILEVLQFFPVLKRKYKHLSSLLSGGEQQMLALARGLMANPSVLLLDEPTLGLAPKVVSEVFEKIIEINERHKTAVMIVEHNIHSVLSFVHRGYILDKGEIIFSAPSDQIAHSHVLQSIFLGR